MHLEKLKLIWPAILIPDRARMALPSWAGRYGVAAVCALIAFAVRYSLAPLLHERMAFMCFIPAALIAASYGGVGPGLLALGLGMALGSWFFIEPGHVFAPLRPEEWIRLAICLGTTAISVVIIDRLHRSKTRAAAMHGKLLEQRKAEESRESLAQHARELEERVAERTAKQEETFRSLEGVLYHVAHDLRAPLRAMDGFAQILFDSHTQLDPVGRDYAARIIAAASRMDQLIQDLLAYGRLTHMELRCRKIDLDVEVARVLAELGVEIKARRAEIEVRRPLNHVWANPAVLDQILVNLLSNALKFVDLNVPPRIVLGVSRQAGRVRLWVKDNGIGIDEAYRNQIFHVFGRLHSADEFPGTGIGLAIVRKGAERMGGTAGVDSKPGRGSCFWVELPKSPCELAEVRDSGEYR
jgi:signal transduction histidine kinase